VALLEMDLRKPKLSKLLNVPREPGISNYLIGKAKIEDIVKDTGIENLYVVSAGAIPPNPTELMSSPRFGEMMKELKDRYDYVIIDTAPVGPVSDAQVLREHADTTIFMIRHDHTPKVFLRMIDDLSKQKKFHNMCIVFNGLRRRGFAYGAYGYGGYGYGSYGGYGGYGYGYAEDEKTIWTKLKKFFK
jgi:capsular exopolysaccharide synthesis family protein